MNDDDRRDPLERLRAADPASGVEPREGFADDVVARATTDASDVPAPAPVAELTSERARRRPRWIPIAAVAASLAVVGAVGYGIGATTGGATNLADGAAPPISLSSPEGTGVTEQGAVGPMVQDNAGAADSRMGAGGGGSMIAPWGWGRNSFRASGLSDSDGTGRAYAYDAQSVATTETVAALAAALGVEGTPELSQGAWIVGPQDGTTPALWVSLDGTLSFSYSNPLISPWNCKEEADSCGEPTGPLPSEQAAIDAARSLVTAAGRDPDEFEFTTETWEGAITRTAMAWPVVDGQRLDQAWTVEVGDQGMISGYGLLADIVELGDYPIVSEQDGFERLSDPRFSAQVTAMPAAVLDGDVGVASPEWVPPTEPPAAPVPGASVSWPVNDVEIVDARLGLATQWQADGSVVIVPAYAFTDADGGTWSMIAVDDEKLDFASE